MNESLDAKPQNLVVYCAGSPWEGPVGTDRHMASRLSQWAPVLFVDPPFPLWPKKWSKVKKPRLRKIGPRLLHIAPWSVPGLTKPGLRTVTRLLTRRALASAVNELGLPVHAVIVASLDDLFGACREKHRIFYGTDDFVAGAALTRLSPLWIERREREQLLAATLKVAVSDRLANRWNASGHQASVIHNGCDCAAFSHVDKWAIAPDIRLPDPIIGLIGQLSDRIDFDLLEAVANTGQSLLLVGPVRKPIDKERLQALLVKPNVQWVGERSYEELPGYIRAMTVGITPYADTEFNRSSVPLKTLEYLAAGRRVVASDLPSARALRSDLFRIASTPAEFASFTLEELFRTEPPSLKMQRQAFAAGHDWNKRALEFAKLIGIVEEAE
jgi:teichuronic acid biosynthesis glycosyltransferase TuaH